MRVFSRRSPRGLAAAQVNSRQRTIIGLPAHPVASVMGRGLKKKAARPRH